MCSRNSVPETIYFWIIVTQNIVNTHRKFNFIVKCKFFCWNALQTAVLFLNANVAVDFSFLFVVVVISLERLVIRCHFSSFMSSFQSRVACRNIP